MNILMKTYLDEDIFRDKFLQEIGPTNKARTLLFTHILITTGISDFG